MGLGREGRVREVEEGKVGREGLVAVEAVECCWAEEQNKIVGGC